jgi:uncharacterized iron-regulated membrane protein
MVLLVARANLIKRVGMAATDGLADTRVMANTNAVRNLMINYLVDLYVAGVNCLGLARQVHEADTFMMNLELLFVTLDLSAVYR